MPTEDYVRRKACFLQFFAVTLVLAVAAFFSAARGFPQLVWASDLSYATSVIAVVFVGSMAYMGWLSWRLCPEDLPRVRAGAEWGSVSANLCTMIGLIGTTLGLSFQAQTLASGSAGLAPLATSLYTTMVGVGAGAILTLVDHNLQSGISRVGRFSE